MAGCICFVLLIMLVLLPEDVSSAEGRELLRNSNFEESVGWANWYCNSCVGFQVNWGNDNKAYKATSR